jgi:hypothetical protein
MGRATPQRLEALGALARLLPSFTDRGLRALERAALEGRLVRGVWSAAGDGCPLSCADGVLGMSGARRFLWNADDRNRFVFAWDAGLVGVADVVALVHLEQDQRVRRRQVGRALRHGLWRALRQRAARGGEPAPA